MPIGSNAFAMRGRDKTKENLKIAIENAINDYNAYLRKLGYHDEKAIKLEKNIEIAEYNLYCYEEEDRIRRNWK